MSTTVPGGQTAASTPKSFVLGNPIGRAARLGVSRVRYEVRSYFRQGDAVFFTFLFPVLLLAIFSVAFGDQEFGRTADGSKLTAAQYYLPAMLAAGILLSGLQNLAVGRAASAATAH